MSRILISSLVLVLVANMAMSDLAPSIDYKGVEIQPIGENKYNLRIVHSDGSTLVETVQRNDLGQYELKGKLIQPDLSPLGRLLVSYKKNKNSPVTRYLYIPPEPNQENK